MMRTTLFRLFLLALTLHFSTVRLKAQADDALWSEFVQWFLDDEECEQSGVDDVFNDLVEIHNYPINLNSATRAQLERLHFLSDSQIEDIIAHVYRYGPLESVRELRLVRSLSFEQVRFLSLFLTVDKKFDNSSIPSLSEVLNGGKGEFVSRIDIPFNTKAGYKHQSDSVLSKYPNRVYQGSSFYKSERLTFRYRSNIFLGLTAEKDAGEPFFSKGNKGYDSYSAYFMLQDIGRIRSLVLGNYRMSIGEGLVLNTGFSFGKGTSTGSASSLVNIRRHSSTSETGYLTGVAGSVNLSSHFMLSGFFSTRKVDANMSGEPLLITSLKTDGYHRTQLEMSKKGNCRNTLYGGALGYQKGSFQLQFTALLNSYQHPFITGASSYRRYYPEGSRFTNYSVSYVYLSRLLSLSGETAIDESGAIATLNKVQVRFSSAYRLNLVQRYYSHRYNAILSNGFSEGGSVKNEAGLYAALSSNPSGAVSWKCFADVFQFPWKRWGVSKASWGADLGAESSLRLNSRFSLFGRYRAKLKQKDDSWGELMPYSTHRAKVRLDYQASDKLVLKGMVDASLVHTRESGNHSGVMFSSLASYNPTERFRSSLSASLFFTDNYDTRLYSYEPGMLYSFSFASFYGHGCHVSLLSQYSFNKSLSCRLKLSATRYFNRSTIGSALEQIDGCHKEDVAFQVRYLF